MAHALTFQVKISVELVKGNRELAAIQASDRAELREMLQNIAMSVDELRTLHRMQSPATAEIMENIGEVCWYLSARKTC